MSTVLSVAVSAVNTLIKYRAVFTVQLLQKHLIRNQLITKVQTNVLAQIAF